MSTTPNPLTEIFCSCSPKDKRYLDALEKHLALLQRQGLIIFHHSLEIRTGNKAQAINAFIESASIILPLVSPEYFASNACQREMQLALKHYQTGGVTIIPIILRSEERRVGKECRSR